MNMPEQKDFILFVCTGNTCRSPMAAALLRHEWEKRPHAPALRVASAGLAAVDGEKASEHARTVMREAGIDLETHTSTLLNKALVDEATLILVMSRQHRELLLQRFPEAAAKTFLLKEFAGITGNPDVADPYGGTIEEYRRVYEEIRASIQEIVRILERSKQKKMKIALGSDHAGFPLKELIREHLIAKKVEVTDFGTFSEGSVDYPDIALPLIKTVAAGEFPAGILVCGTGIGMTIAANKYPGIRAALCGDTFSARCAREHNNANVLTLGARVTGPGPALEIVDIFLNSSFQGGRHSRRLKKITFIENVGKRE